MSTFNDDLSSDMNDPEFAAEFERTTDEVRLERYAAAIAAADDMRKDWCYAEADAAMAVADGEIRIAKMEAAQIITRRWSEWSARANLLIQDLRSDLQESADALDESAQTLEDALDESERLRAELEDVKRKHENFKKGSDAGGKEMRKRLTDADAENTRLRAELARARQRLVLADEFAKEHSCLTPDYTEGPCHCVHCDPYSIDRDNNRLRAELEASARELSSVVDDRNMYQHKEAEAVLESSRLRAELADMAHDAERRADAASKDAVARLDAESTISRVRAVLDTADVSDRETGFFQDVRDALNGESE